MSAVFGQYLGVSKEHASTVGLIRNLKTGKITPQYHLVYDNWFSSVPNFSNPEKVQDKIDLENILTVKEGELVQHVDEEFDEVGLRLEQPWLDA